VSAALAIASAKSGFRTLLAETSGQDRIQRTFGGNGCQSEEVNNLLNQGLGTGDMATFVKAGDVYGQTGCFLNLSYNQDWVVAQKWLTGVPESQNIGANELNFSLLGIAK